MAGRPSKYSDALADDICELIMSGKTLVGIAALEGFPSPATICRWLNEKPEFENKCARARLMQAELMDQRILDVADDTDEDNFQANRVKIAAYQWRASKLAPKRFGDKVQQEVSGPNGGAIQAAVTVTFVKPV